MIRLPLIAYVGIFAGLCLLFGIVQTHRLKAEKAAYSAFRADVRAKGEAAEKAAQEQVKRDQKAKESVDAQNRRLRAANDSLSRGLLDARTARGYVPAPSAGTGDPDRACFSRAELERALQQLDAGVSGLIGEGDTARVNLDSAKDWANAREGTKPRP